MIVSWMAQLELRDAPTSTKLSFQIDFFDHIMKAFLYFIAQKLLFHVVDFVLSVVAIEHVKCSKCRYLN